MAGQMPESRSLDESPYFLPDWFLVRNVKTFAEGGSTDTSRKRFNGSNENDNAASAPHGEHVQDEAHMGCGSPTATTNAVPTELLSELRELTAISLVRDRSGELLSTCSTIVVRCTTRLALPLIDEMLLRVAEEFKATLVSVGMEDLEDLGWEFHQQDRERQATSHNAANAVVGPSLETSGGRNMFDGMAAHYFGVRPKRKAEPEEWDRSIRAMAAVLDGHAFQCQQHGSSGCTPKGQGDPAAALSGNNTNAIRAQDTPLLLHIRNYNEMAVMQNGHRYAKRFWDSVQGRRFVSRQRVVLVFSMFHVYKSGPGYGHDYYYGDVYPDQRYVFNKISPEAAALTVDIDPGTLPETGDEPEEIVLGESNIRRLKRFLRYRIPHLLAPALAEAAAIDQPFSTWVAQGFEGTYESMTAEDWAPEAFQRAACRIAARGFERAAISFRDVQDVLVRLELCELAERQEPEPEFPGSGQMDAEEPAPGDDAEGSALGEDEAEELDEKNSPPERASDYDERISEESPETTPEPSESWNEKLARVRYNLDNEYETALMGNVVNPDNLETTFDDVIIDDETKRTIRFLVSLSQFSPEAESALLLKQLRATGALFYGPPGTGKTHLSRAIAKASGSCMLAIDAAAMQSKWVGDTNKYIRAAFSVAAKLSPCVLFIDEVDSLFYRRASDDRTWERSALAQFLSGMDGLTKRTDGGGGAPFVVVATNRPQDLDEAFYRRLPHKVYFRLPDTAARLRILQLFLPSGDVHPRLDLAALARCTEGYSGSDLRSLCSEAAMVWALEQMEASTSSQAGAGAGAMVESKMCMGASHFAKSLRKIRPSVSPETLGAFALFARRFNPDAVDGGELAPGLQSEALEKMLEVEEEPLDLLATHATVSSLNSRGGMHGPDGDAVERELR